MHEDPQPAVADLLGLSGFGTLGDDPPLDAVAGAVRSLAENLAEADVDDVTRAAAREGAIAQMKDAGVRSPARLVDAALSSGSTDGDGDGGSGGVRLHIEDVDPWPDAVDGAALLDDLRAALRRWLVLPDGADVAVALWVLNAHAHDAATISPLLAITSATHRCGKTTLLDVLGALVPRPLPASSITPSALFRAVERFTPTLLVDEADTFLGDRSELRGLLNSGHNRAGAVVVRSVPVDDGYEAEVFSTWAPKAVALIGRLPSTLADRSIEIRMRRRMRGEHVERLRLDRLHDEVADARRRAARWAADHLKLLRGWDPEVPPQLDDRAADNWRPLLAIAELAGVSSDTTWPARARGAALTLSADRSGDDTTAGVMVLEDIKAMFESEDTDRLRSREIADALAELEHRPWPEWSNGHPITPHALARLLEPFGIEPRRMMFGSLRRRGYARDDFADVWARYMNDDDGGG